METTVTPTSPCAPTGPRVYPLAFANMIVKIFDDLVTGGEGKPPLDYVPEFGGQICFESTPGLIGRKQACTVFFAIWGATKTFIAHSIWKIHFPNRLRCYTKCRQENQPRGSMLTDGCWVLKNVWSGLFAIKIMHKFVILLLELDGKSLPLWTVLSWHPFRKWVLYKWETSALTTGKLEKNFKYVANLMALFRTVQGH
jgi:hypothetical protein